MTSKYLSKNKDVLEAKGDIPYWMIADRLGVHENTVRNWLKKELDSEKKGRFLSAVEEIKLESLAAN